METKTKNFVIVGVLIAILIAIAAPFLASSNPDGLESAAEKILNPGVSDEAVMESPMPDYIVPSLGESGISGSIAIVIGVLIVFALAYLIGVGLKRKA
ncbi:PDGLE domain-containing protein [Methanobrevibacter sp. OttesenSCG-928-K11]|nr:PDGLE domain-containing protein [Methanobrevibacter sp. OttesenSCG-928-K11]MDL2270735.1 PDGLE domain-containing protein [Methanobrevibacter sp. OttesenSCG-928-I08]